MGNEMSLEITNEMSNLITISEILMCTYIFKGIGGINVGLGNSTLPQLVHRVHHFPHLLMATRLMKEMYTIQAIIINLRYQANYKSHFHS